MKKVWSCLLQIIICSKSFLSKLKEKKKTISDITVVYKSFVSNLSNIHEQCEEWKDAQWNWFLVLKKTSLISKKWALGNKIVIFFRGSHVFVKNHLFVFTYMPESMLWKVFLMLTGTYCTCSFTQCAKY